MEKPLFSICSIRPDEWEKYRAVRLQALQDSPDAFASTHAAEMERPDELWSSRIAAAADSPTDRALFAIKNDEVCGLAWCKVSASEHGFADLFQMWVEPKSRGHGIGAALLREAINFARNTGAGTLRLEVTVAESAAMNLYRSHGFVPVGAEEPLREGLSICKQTMHLHLDGAA
jgi:ribosomal protein S18 acetylase RimI-like enzyme